MSAAVIFLISFFAYRKKLPQTFIKIIKSLGTAVNEDSEVFVSKKTLPCLSVAVVITVMGVLLFQLPDMAGEPIISLTAITEIPAENEITKANFEKNYNFEISPNRNYRDYDFSIQLDAEGYLTDIRILDENSNTVYQNVAEKISAYGTIGLNPGSYTILVTHLLSQDAFQSYCIEMNYDFDGETIETLEASYEHTAKTPELSLIIK